jgi:uncharacterized spore protein YtfJ
MQDNTVPAEFAASETRAGREEAGDVTAATGQETVRRVIEGVRDTFTARTVYGEPIEAHGVTVIPVAATYFGFGAGGGGGRGGSSGGGGGGTVRPIGFIEITALGARWVPITRPWQRVAVGVVAPVLALLAGRVVRRRLLAGAKEG